VQSALLTSIFCDSNWSLIDVGFTGPFLIKNMHVAGSNQDELSQAGAEPELKMGAGSNWLS
jgi:hypothetical protein